MIKDILTVVITIALLAMLLRNKRIEKFITDKKPFNSVSTITVLTSVLILVVMITFSR